MCGWQWGLPGRDGGGVGGPWGQSEPGGRVQCSPLWCTTLRSVVASHLRTSGTIDDSAGGETDLDRMMAFPQHEGNLVTWFKRTPDRGTYICGS